MAGQVARQDVRLGLDTQQPNATPRAPYFSSRSCVLGWRKKVLAEAAKEGKKALGHFLAKRAA
jgi:hypothetical protein